MTLFDLQSDLPTEVIAVFWFLLKCFLFLSFILLNAAIETVSILTIIDHIIDMTITSLSFFLQLY